MSSEMWGTGKLVIHEGSHFTGDVSMTPTHKGEPPSRLTAVLVRFTPGARTDRHSHEVGQTLHVTDGVGLVATWDGEVVRVRAADER